VVGFSPEVISAFRAYSWPGNVRELRQVIADEAKSAGTHNDERIRKAILLKADENRLPVGEDDIQISRKTNDIYIDVEYTVPVKFPGFTYQWKQHHHFENPIF